MLASLAKLGGDELLPAVDVIGCAREGGVDYSMAKPFTDLSLQSHCELHRQQLILQWISGCYPRRSLLRRDVKYFSNLWHDHVAQ
jgi:hypothetical protein